eukprot:TRINITY_DN11499_c0_g1_i1.p1 TRINITY_DN11499_c0_g1~~TRINITY_DN11499_c0_g1_i1.p1  ORF type:complete len:167 (+),score=4.09 TRINITY_DN11499_c0_g1_i1:83-583(+)
MGSREASALCPHDCTKSRFVSRFGAHFNGNLNWESHRWYLRVPALNRDTFIPASQVSYYAPASRASKSATRASKSVSSAAAPATAHASRRQRTKPTTPLRCRPELLFLQCYTARPCSLARGGEKGGGKTPAFRAATANFNNRSVITAPWSRAGRAPSWRRPLAVLR